MYNWITLYIPETHATLQVNYTSVNKCFAQCMVLSRYSTNGNNIIIFSSVQSLSRVQLFVTPCTAASQTSLSITNSRSLLKLISIDSVMPSNHLILCYSLSPPAFNLSQHQGLFKWVSSSYQVAKVLEFQLQHQSFQTIFRTDFL